MIEFCARVVKSLRSIGSIEVAKDFLFGEILRCDGDIDFSFLQCVEHRLIRHLGLSSSDVPICSRNLTERQHLNFKIRPDSNVGGVLERAQIIEDHADACLGVIAIYESRRIAAGGRDDSGLTTEEGNIKRAVCRLCWIGITDLDRRCRTRDTRRHAGQIHADLEHFRHFDFGIEDGHHLGDFIRSGRAFSCWQSHFFSGYICHVFKDKVTLICIAFRRLRSSRCRT